MDSGSARQGSLAEDGRPGRPHLEEDVLGWILGLSDSTQFVSMYRGKRWYHAKCKDRDRFGELLSLGELDEVLGTYGVRHPDIRLVRADGEVPRSEYVWRDGMVDPAQAARLFAAGATVIFRALHDRHEGTRLLCSSVAKQVAARTQTNIYLTPPASQGFKPHWDTHDVFVLQVQGSKRWRIYEGGPRLPLKDQKFDPESHSAGELIEEFTLQAGEALYIPRGVMHAAATTEEVSLHITLGVLAYTWADLLIDSLSELVERSPEWRDDLPVGFSHLSAQLDVELRLAELLLRLPDELDVSQVVAERQAMFENHQRPRVKDILRQSMVARALDEGDLVRWRSGTLGSFEERDGRVIVRCGVREIDLPVSATPTLECLAAGEVAIAGAIDDGLDWESRKVVLQALIREGLVRNDSALPEV